MSKDEPTNGELGIMISSLRELFEQKFAESAAADERVDIHLTKLNGQVAKNTSFATSMKAYGAIAVFVIPIVISVIVKLV